MDTVELDGLALVVRDESLYQRIVTLSNRSVGTIAVPAKRRSGGPCVVFSNSAAVETVCPGRHCAVSQADAALQWPC